jgi:hypothetical protein
VRRHHPGSLLQDGNGAVSSYTLMRDSLHLYGRTHRAAHPAQRRKHAGRAGGRAQQLKQQPMRRVKEQSMRQQAMRPSITNRRRLLLRLGCLGWACEGACEPCVAGCDCAGGGGASRGPVPWQHGREEPVRVLDGLQRQPKPSAHISTIRLATSSKKQSALFTPASQNWNSKRFEPLFHCAVLFACGIRTNLYAIRALNLEGYNSKMIQGTVVHVTPYQEEKAAPCPPSWFRNIKVMKQQYDGVGKFKRLSSAEDCTELRVILTMSMSFIGSNGDST